MGNAVGVALDGDGGREAGDGDGAVELRERVSHRLAEPVARDEGADDNDEDDERGEGDDDASEDTAACGLQRGLFGSEGLVGDYVGVGEMGKVHNLIQGLNRKCKRCVMWVRRW